MSRPKHILVIRLSAMGDVAMTAPVLNAFSKQYPDVKLTVLTKPFFKPLFKNNPNIHVFEADIKQKHKGILGLWKLSKELKTLKFDAVADLHNVLRSKILKFFFFGMQVVQIDKGRQEKRALITGQTFAQLKTTHQRYADVFEQLGFSLDLSQPIFPEKANLNQKHFDCIGIDSRPWIGIAPFAAFKGKTYPIDLMEQVIKALSQSYKVILFGGGTKEIQILENIANRFETVVSLAGQFSLAEELDIISNLELMVSMDSGNSHLAAMLGVNVITIWGVTHPYAGFSPFNQNTDAVIMANRTQFPKIPTSVYGNKLPEGYEEVMRSITPQDIIAKITAVLN